MRVSGDPIKFSPNDVDMKSLDEVHDFFRKKLPIRNLPPLRTGFALCRSLESGVSVLEDLSHLFQCDVECVGWGVFLRRGGVSVTTPPAAFEIRGGRTDGHYGHAVGGGSAMAGWSHAPRRRKPADDDWG